MKVVCIKEADYRDKLEFKNDLHPRVGYEYTVLETFCDKRWPLDFYYSIKELSPDCGYKTTLFIELKSRTEEADEILKTINPEIHEPEQC